MAGSEEIVALMLHLSSRPLIRNPLNSQPQLNSAREVSGSAMYYRAKLEIGAELVFWFS